MEAPGQKLGNGGQRTDQEGLGHPRLVELELPVSLGRRRPKSRNATSDLDHREPPPPRLPASGSQTRRSVNRPWAPAGQGDAMGTSAARIAQGGVGGLVEEWLGLKPSAAGGACLLRPVDAW